MVSMQLKEDQQQLWCEVSIELFPGIFSYYSTLLPKSSEGNADYHLSFYSNIKSVR